MDVIKKERELMIKKERELMRKHFSKICKELDQMLLDKDTSKQHLLVVSRQLEDKSDRLFRADDNIRTSLLSSEIDEATFEEEYDQVEYYRKELIKYRSKCKFFLKNEIEEDQCSSRSCSEHSKKKFRLPEIEFRKFDRNSLAKHLAVCEKKAYPSEADAKSATVMHSMFDILGLVRKPEESKNEKPSENSDVQEKNESTEESFKVSNKEIDSNEIDVLSDGEIGTVISNRENVNGMPVEVDSENAAPEYKKDKQIKSTNLEEISDKNDNISDEKKGKEILHNEKSEIVDSYEEDVIMSEFTESDYICDKTKTTGIDHLSLTQNESQDQSSEIRNSNSEDKQVNLHTIEKSIEQRIKKGHIDMEVNEYLDKNTADVFGPKMTKSTTDETIGMEKFHAHFNEYVHWNSQMRKNGFQERKTVKKKKNEKGSKTKWKKLTIGMKKRLHTRNEEDAQRVTRAGRLVVAPTRYGYQ